MALSQSSISYHYSLPNETLHTVLDEGIRLALRHKVCAIPGSACGSLAARIDDIFWWGCNLPQVVFGAFWHVFWYYFIIQSCTHGGPWWMARCQVLLANCGCAMPTCLQPSALWRPSVWRCGGPAIPTSTSDQKMDEHGWKQHATWNFDEIWLSWEMRGIDWIDILVISCYFSSLLRLVWLSCRRTARPYWRNEQDQLLAASASQTF